jgi:threonine/homoserine/homoserine lactone efflux protein
MIPDPGCRPAPGAVSVATWSAGQLLAFAVASFIMIVIPGPSVLFVIGRALAHGRRTALATVVGNAAGGLAMIGLGVSVAVTGRKN